MTRSLTFIAVGVGLCLAAAAHAKDEKVRSPGDVIGWTNTDKALQRATAKAIGGFLPSDVTLLTAHRPFYKPASWTADTPAGPVRCEADSNIKEATCVLDKPAPRKK